MSRSFDLSGVRKAIERVAATKKAADQAVRQARSTVVRRVKTFTRRDIQGEYNLRAARVDQGLVVRQSADAIEIIGAKRGIGEIEFGGRHSRKQKGASSQVRRDRARSVDPGSFIATFRGGNKHMAIRDSRRRLPISILYGPSIAQMLRRPGRAERIGEFARSVLAAEIERILR